MLFHDEIDPDEIPDLYAQCHVGMVALDQRHQSHNIPGKFVAYMQSGLPVIANINPGNDLVDLIRTERVGRVSEDNTVDKLYRMAKELLEEIEFDKEVSERCKGLFDRMFSVETTVLQIVAALGQRG